MSQVYGSVSNISTRSIRKDKYFFWHECYNNIYNKILLHRDTDILFHNEKMGGE